MITVVVCGGLAFLFLGALAASLWRAHRLLAVLEADAVWDAHVADALDVAFDPDHEDFRQWQEQMLWPEYRPRFRPWIEPEGQAG